MSITLVLLAVSVACNVWFLLLLLYERIMETRLVRFFKDIAKVWKALHAEEQKKETERTPAQAVDVIGKSRFKMTSNRTMATIPEPQAATSEEGIALSEEDTTFDDGNKEAEPHPAQVPAEKLDEVFSNIPPSEMEYGEDEPDDDTPDSRQVREAVSTRLTMRSGPPEIPMPRKRRRSVPDKYSPTWREPNFTKN